MPAVVQNGQQDHVGVAGAGIRSDEGTQLHAIQLRHHPVRDDHVVGSVLVRLPRLGAVRGDLAVVAEPFESPLEDATRDCIVLSDQHSHDVVDLRWCVLG
jgi:hypothetical protein